MIRRQALREAEAQKHRTGRIIENLKRQVEIEVQSARQETVSDLKELRKKEERQLKGLQNDVVGLDQVKQSFVDQFQVLLKELEEKLEHFRKPISDRDLEELKIATLQGNNNLNENNVRMPVSSELLAEIEKKLSQQIEVVKTDSDEVTDILLDELSDDLDDVWAEVSTDD